MPPRKTMKILTLISILFRSLSPHKRFLPFVEQRTDFRIFPQRNTSSYPLLLRQLFLHITSKHRPKTLPILPTPLALCFKPHVSSLRRNRSSPRLLTQFPEQACTFSDLLDVHLLCSLAEHGVQSCSTPSHSISHSALQSEWT